MTSYISCSSAKTLTRTRYLIISNVYWGHKVNPMVEILPTEETEDCLGVKQDCILSLLLFNLYGKAIFKETLVDEFMG